MTHDILNTLSQSLNCKQGAVRAVRFSADGNYCLTCGSDKTFKLWNPHKAALIKTYSGHGYEVLDAKGAYDNSTICSCGMDKSVILWDVASGKVLRKYRGHAGCVNCVDFNDEATVILSGSIDGTVKCWDTRTRGDKPIQTLDDAKDSVTTIEVTDHEILTGSADSRIRRYDLRSGELVADFMGKPVTCVSFTRDRNCILVSTLDGTLRLIDRDTGELLNEYRGHKNESYKIDSCVTSNDTYILTGSEDGKVYIYDLVETKVVKTLAHKTSNTVHSLSHHPKENCLLTATKDTVYLWTYQTAEEMTT